MRRALAALALAVCTLGLAGCGDEETPADDGGSDASVKSIDITIDGDDVTPNGDRVDVEVGQQIEFVVQSDAAGSIHVHSEPEHEYKYGDGTTTLPPFTIDKPGIVEVESHELDVVILQLQAK